MRMEKVFTKIISENLQDSTVLRVTSSLTTVMDSDK